MTSTGNAAKSNNSSADKGSLANPDGEWTEEDLQHMREEWYYLYEQFQTFKKQSPETHPLFAKAVGVLRKDQSLDYHRAVYETLCNMLKLIQIAKDTERKQAESQGRQGEPEDAPPQMREMVQREVITLQIGYTLGSMLKKWPKGGEPTMKNTPPLSSGSSATTDDDDNDDDDAPE